MKNLFKDAEFKYEIGNELCARFDFDYINGVRNYADNDLKNFLGSILKSYGRSVNKKGNIFLNRNTVEWILEEIRDFVKNKKWNDCRR